MSFRVTHADIVWTHHVWWLPIDIELSIGAGESQFLMPQSIISLVLSFTHSPMKACICPGQLCCFPHQETTKYFVVKISFL